MINLAFQLMLYGLAGVFSALAIFYAAIKLMVAIAAGREKKE
jgi:Na+-transporting methylmalonyl-CoA/oxaloacetate decarboxylase gamma subunit